MKAVRLAWWLWVGAAAGMIALASILGCATERYLSEEQDAQFKAMCEKDGCQVIPSPAWERIEYILKQLGLIAS